MEETLQPDEQIDSDLQETDQISDPAPSTLMMNSSAMDSGPALLGVEPDKLILGHLLPQGRADKPMVAVILQQVHPCNTLLDTGSDYTLMCKSVFKRICLGAGGGIRPPELNPCAVTVRVFSPSTMILSSRSLLHFTIGPLTLTHPMYICECSAVTLYHYWLTLISLTAPVRRPRALQSAHLRRPLEQPHLHQSTIRNILCFSFQD
ncbi:uncharacterized protein [Nothobranchius furzeri]|uniref:uncharacterized protein isoform X1 n=1 Tax=Nothobranchius furzeri TaxID=105023 RepID=UPI00240489C9|nr:uncharacterized protein LOC129160759 [Nothobranchius furzeri]